MTQGLRYLSQRAIACDSSCSNIHTLQHTRAWFDEMEMRVLKRPARSPDLNPMKNVWAVLASKVYANAKQFSSVSELTAAILAAWDTIRLPYLRSLIESLPKRCIEIVRRKGCKFPY